MGDLFFGFFQPSSDGLQFWSHESSTSVSVCGQDGWVNSAHSLQKYDYTSCLGSSYSSCCSGNSLPVLMNSRNCLLRAPTFFHSLLRLSDEPARGFKTISQ